MKELQSNIFSTSLKRSQKISVIYNLKTFIDISQPQYYTHGLLGHWFDSFTTNVQPFSESIIVLNFTYLKCKNSIVV